MTVLLPGAILYLHEHQYYIDLSTKTHTPVKFVQANDNYFWVGLLWKPEG